MVVLNENGLDTIQSAYCSIDKSQLVIDSERAYILFSVIQECQQALDEINHTNTSIFSNGSRFLELFDTVSHTLPNKQNIIIILLVFFLFLHGILLCTLIIYYKYFKYDAVMRRAKQQFSSELVKYIQRASVKYEQTINDSNV